MSNRIKTILPAFLAICILLSSCGAGIEEYSGKETAADLYPAVSTASQTAATASEASSQPVTSASTKTQKATAAAVTTVQTTSASGEPPHTSAETEAPVISVSVSPAATEPPAVTDISSMSVSSAEEIPGDEESLRSRIEERFRLLTSNGAVYSVCASSLDGSFDFSAGSNYRMVSASLIKLFVAGTVYEDQSFTSETEQYSGETEALIAAMISASDNNACNTLVTRLGRGSPAEGMKAVNRFCASHGYNSTEMNRLMLDFNGLENYTTPRDCCRMLQDCCAGRLKGSQQMIGYMKNQQRRWKIPAGITDGTVVANKTGELNTVENDSAIVFLPQKTYTLCIMVNSTYDTGTAVRLISETAGDIHNCFKGASSF